MRQDAFSRYHPAVNFVFFLGAIGLGVVIQHPAYLAAGCVAAGSYYLLLHGWGGLWMLGSMVPLFLVLSLINPLFNTQGERVLFVVFGRPYTLEALYYGMAVAAIFVITLLWFGCYSRVLTSDKFVCLFGGIAPGLAMLLVMVLRMIPNLLRKARQISGARQCVGFGKEDTKRAQLQEGAVVLSALTDWALEGSVVTADAMRARGYGAARRTSFRIYRMTVRDWGLLGAMAVLLAAALLGGGMSVSFVPALRVAPVGWGLGAYGLFLLIPTLLQIMEDTIWRVSISRI